MDAQTLNRYLELAQQLLERKDAATTYEDALAFLIETAVDMGDCVKCPRCEVVYMDDDDAFFEDKAECKDCVSYDKEQEELEWLYSTR